jgi:hypothetical protein
LDGGFGGWIGCVDGGGGDGCSLVVDVERFAALEDKVSWR